jgi:hypothetical protein
MEAGSLAARVHVSDIDRAVPPPRPISKIDFSLNPPWFGVQIVKMDHVHFIDHTPQISQI